MKIKNLLFFVFLINLFHISYAKESVDNCYPAINKTQDNYLVGYGSLMNAESRSRTNPNVKVFIPVKVEGFVREWNAITPGYEIIYLGVVPCKSKEKNCFLNGLAYLITDEDAKAADKRENIYCRKEIQPSKITSYQKKNLIDPNAKYWIYVTKPTSGHHPDKTHPIIQSYVDLFIGGCIEQSARIAHKTTSDLIYPDDYGFVFDCVSGTKGWTTDFWLNDRVYPERPWAASPYALAIDEVLTKSYHDKLLTGKHSYMNIPLQ